MLMVVPIVDALEGDAWQFALILFCIAGLTDIADGALARLRNEQTLVGMYLDPVADKLLVIGVYSALAFTKETAAFVPWWYVACVLLKDIVLMLGALGGAFIIPRLTMRPALIGKIAMALQVSHIALIMGSMAYGIIPAPCISTVGACAIFATGMAGAWYITRYALEIYACFVKSTWL